jgi:hypothetical protein
MREDALMDDETALKRYLARARQVDKLKESLCPHALGPTLRDMLAHTSGEYDSDVVRVLNDALLRPHHDGPCIDLLGYLALKAIRKERLASQLVYGVGVEDQVREGQMVAKGNHSVIPPVP